MLRRCYWNSLELAKKNDIHSIAFPSISTGAYGYPKKEAALVALATVSDWMKVNADYGMAITMVCFDEETENLYKGIWESIEAHWNEREELTREEGAALLDEAIHFAVERHSGAFRKGTDKPYILHPMEALQILSGCATDYALLAAAVLHDVLEDTDTSLYELTTLFGNDVARLVNSHTEDKHNIWYVRKAHTIRKLRSADIREKLLAMADKLANLRSIHADHKMLGDELWKRFNAPKEWQAWYYSGVQDAMAELQNYTDTEDIYWEMVAKYKDVFVDFYIDETKEMLYQIGIGGENYVLKKGKPQWNVFDGKLSKRAKLIERKAAERIEDNWAEPFWKLHDKDMEEASYRIFENTERKIDLEVKYNGINIYYNVMEETEEDCSNEYLIAGDAAHRFLVQLRMKHNLRHKLETILKNEFGGEEGMRKLLDFCNEIGVELLCARV